MKKRIAVFGSGIIKEGSPQFKIAYEIGFLLASSGFTIVNGGYGGSMLASAMGAKKAGGTTIGITTDDFREVVKNPFIDREIRKPTWQDRLHYLVDCGDGFVVLDGGTGTLTEFMVVWEMASKKFHKKPIVTLGRRVKSLIKVLRQNPEVKFPKDFRIVSTPKTAVQYLVSYFSHV